MSLTERLGLLALRRLDPERAHGLALTALNAGFAPAPGVITSDRLRTEVAGITLQNPLGLAAGFDKNATALAPLIRSGFGFLEVGAATPLPQPGNPKPRLFRLSEDQAAINRFGFNNDGAKAIAARLAVRPPGVPVGINLGANKDSEDRARDFAVVLELCGPFVDFATVNVSSPNTEKLRDLQGKDALKALLDRVLDTRKAIPNRVPVFLKIAPDLDDRALAEIAEVASETGIDGIIATNTTLDREGLKSPLSVETGGLSGKPLFDKSTRVLARLACETSLPLIGVGGVSDAESAYAKIRAGASAIQLYTSLVYGGLSLVAEILNGLDRHLTRDGHNTIAEAVGIDKETWA